MKKYVIPFIIILIIGILVSYFVYKSKINGSTIESRELRLKQISNLGESTNIDEEIIIDDYIFSGYITKNNRYGLAVFTPAGNGKYDFQTNVNSNNDELIFLPYVINGKAYNLFWANKADLDYAEIIYTIDGNKGEIIKIDAKNNKIIYTEEPSKDFSVEYYFIDVKGKLYK